MDQTQKDPLFTNEQVKDLLGSIPNPDPAALQPCLPEVTGVQRPRCPFLAVYEDPQTAFGYPNDANYCHAGGRPNPVLLEHQDRICLSAVYPQCLVYKQPGKLRPPSGLPKKGAPFWRAPFWRAPLFWIGVAALLAVLILAFILAAAWILL